MLTHIEKWVLNYHNHKNMTRNDLVLILIIGWNFANDQPISEDSDSFIYGDDLAITVQDKDVDSMELKLE